MDELEKKILEAIKKNPEMLKQLGIVEDKPVAVEKKRGRPKKVKATPAVEIPVDGNGGEVEIPRKARVALEDRGSREARTEPIQKGKTVNKFKDTKALAPEDIALDKKMLKNIVDTGSSRPKPQKVQVTCRRCSRDYLVDAHLLPNFSYGASSYVCSKCIGV